MCDVVLLYTIAHVIVDGSMLHYVVIHKIQKQIIIAASGVGILKMLPQEFFREVQNVGKPPKYQFEYQ